MRKYLIALCLPGVVACTGNIVPVESGGDRQEGTVHFSYVHAPGLSPRIDWEQVQVQAVARCSSWGYQNAENTDQLARVCATRGGDTGFQARVRVGAATNPNNPQIQSMGIPLNNCNEIRYTVTYQCSGGDSR